MGGIKGPGLYPFAACTICPAETTRIPIVNLFKFYITTVYSSNHFTELVFEFFVQNK